MRFSLPTLAAPVLLAALVAVAGCDSVEPEAPAGPTIQFGAASVNAAEGDGTVEIPVTLTGGEPGTSYTVEVLFADAASRDESRPAGAPAARRDSSDFTLVYGQDITGFGDAQGRNRTASVTLSGPSRTGRW